MRQAEPLENLPCTQVPTTENAALRGGIRQLDRPSSPTSDLRSSQCEAGRVKVLSNGRWPSAKSVCAAKDRK